MNSLSAEEWANLSDICVRVAVGRVYQRLGQTSLKRRVIQKGRIDQTEDGKPGRHFNSYPNILQRKDSKLFLTGDRNVRNVMEE